MSYATESSLKYFEIDERIVTYVPPIVAIASLWFLSDEIDNISHIVMDLTIRQFYQFILGDAEHG